MVYKVDGNPQLDSRDWSMYSNILKSGMLFDLSSQAITLIIDLTPNRPGFSESGKAEGGGVDSAPLCNVPI